MALSDVFNSYFTNATKNVRQESANHKLGRILRARVPICVINMVGKHTPFSSAHDSTPDQQPIITISVPKHQARYAMSNPLRIFPLFVMMGKVPFMARGLRIWTTLVTTSYRSTGYIHVKIINVLAEDQSCT